MLEHVQHAIKGAIVETQAIDNLYIQPDARVTGHIDPNVINRRRLVTQRNLEATDVQDVPFKNRYKTIFDEPCPAFTGWKCSVLDGRLHVGNLNGDGSGSWWAPRLAEHPVSRRARHAKLEASHSLEQKGINPPPHACGMQLPEFS